MVKQRNVFFGRKLIEMMMFNNNTEGDEISHRFGLRVQRGAGGVEKALLPQIWCLVLAGG